MILEAQKQGILRSMKLQTRTVNRINNYIYIYAINIIYNYIYIYYMLNILITINILNNCVYIYIYTIYIYTLYTKHNA